MTVIVPTFNAAPELGNLFDYLVVSQGVEVIFIDDGSQDETRAILHKIVATTPDFKLLYSDHVGPGPARSIGLREAKGRFVTFVDADDEVDLAVLLDGCREADDRRADVVIFDYQQVGLPHGQPFPRSPQISYRSVRSFRTLVSRAAVWGKVYRASYIRSHMIDFEAVEVAEDVLFSWDVSTNGPNTIESSTISYRYFTHAHGQLTRERDYALEAVESLRLLLARSKSAKFFPRLLSLYGWAAGSSYLLRRTPRGKRLRVVHLSATALVRGMLSSMGGDTQ